MDNSKIGDFNSLKFNNLSKFEEINHFVTTKKFAEDQGLNTEDQIKIISQTLNDLDITTNILYQMHGNQVVIVDESKNNFIAEKGDAMISKTPKQCLLIKTADCIPIFMYDPKNKVIASIHAGWRGILKTIASQTITNMINNFHSDPKDIVVGIGPGIGPDVYEVGKSVFTSFMSEDKGYKGFFVKKSTEKYLLDLWKLNEYQLLKSGVLKENIEMSNICNYSNPKDFYSVRREGSKTGRILSGIYLK